METAPLRAHRPEHATVPVGLTRAPGGAARGRGHSPGAAALAWVGALVAWLSLSTPSFAQIVLEPLVAGLPGPPVAITHAGDGSGRLFLTLQSGQVRVFDGGQLLPTPFLDIRRRISNGGERGLLSVAFHPDYGANGLFYVYYTNLEGSIVIAQYSVSANPDVADPTSEVVRLTIPHPDAANHNGGQLQFAPDGCLYAGVGDGGGGGDLPNNAQNPDTLLGKLLRLDPASGLPCAAAPGNPFGDRIWALGLRNPWRFSFDRATGDLYIGDVGQNSWEEVNVQPAGSAGGQNYGWRRMEGSHCFNPSSNCNDGTLTLPIVEYGHTNGNCSITGGYRYRGTGIPGLAGTYLYADFCSGRIWGATEAGGSWTATELLDAGFQVSSFGEDEAGELYVADYGAHAIHRVTTDHNVLLVTRAGTGSGVVTSDTGDIDCGTTCRHDYDLGTAESITLTATALPGSVFAGWSGVCAGIDPCTLTMDGDRSTTATFDLVTALSFGAPTYSVSEGAGKALITVVRTGPAAPAVTVQYATSPGTATPGVDYVETLGTLTFGPGVTLRQIRVPILNDALPEPDETVSLTLSGPTGGAVLGAPTTATLTITDNDPAGAFRFSASAYSVKEFMPAITITVKRVGGASGLVTVDYAASPASTATAGSDYTLAAGTLTFAPGETSKSFQVFGINDGVAEPSETVVLTLSTPTGGATLGTPSTAVLTIVDDDD